MLDNSRKSWFKVMVNGQFVTGLARMTELQAWTLARQRYGNKGTIEIVEHPPGVVAMLNDKFDKAIKNGGSSL